MIEETLVIVKPDATARGLTDEILARFEAAGFEVVQQRRERPTEEFFHQLYAEHSAKPHFPALLAYMMSGEACFVRLRREDAIEEARCLVGPTDPDDAPEGTIRGDIGIDFRRNSVHAADCAASAKRELALAFPD